MKKLFLIFGLLSFFCSIGYSQTFPPGFSYTNIGSGWVNPVGSAFTPDGQKLFVWEKRGQVYVCNRNGSGIYIKQATPVLNIEEEVGNWRDFGMLGFALDPNFAVNGFIYVLYVVDRHHLLYFGTPSYNSTTNEYYNATIGRITRYQTSTVSSDLVANPASRTILLGETKKTGIPILHESHGTGALVFAADGTLLASTGDGGSYASTDDGGGNGGGGDETYYLQALADSIIRPQENVGAFRAQMVNSLNGKILRLNPSNGNGMPSNPFYDPSEPRAANSRVWALGLRNPFNFTIKPGTGSTNPATGDIGELFIGDVGWNTWEDLHIINDKGVNCGWPLFEGLTSHSSYQSANTQNQDEPNPLYNGTTCSRPFFRFKELLKQATADNIKTVYNPCNASMPIGTGNRYFHLRPSLDWHHTNLDARVGIFSGNNAAVATIGTAQSGVTGSPFKGNTSIAGAWYTGNKYPVQYRNTYFHADYGASWLKSIKVDFIDKVTAVQGFATGFAAITNVTQNPLDSVLVYVDYWFGFVRTINYAGNQLPVVIMTSDKKYGPTILNVAFNSSGTYDPDGTIASRLWNFGDGTPTSNATNPTHDFTAPPGVPTKYVVKLTVTDNSGGSSVDSIIISVNNTPPVVNITSPVKNSQYVPGPDTLYSCIATVTDSEHTPGQLKYAWQTILRHNNHQHSEPIDTNKTTSALISRIGCNGDSYYWQFRLTVTDAAGLFTVDSSNIFPTCTAQGPLSLFLRKFSVTQQGNINLVTWTTEQEQNLAYFEVERSTDGVLFTTVNRQAAKNIAQENNYSFPDNNFQRGILYYRLKILEMDGQIRYSLIIKTFTGNKLSGLTIVPNPGKDDFAVIFSTDKHDQVNILVRDINGRIVQKRNEIASPGQNIIYLSDFGKQKAGIYFITLQQGDVIRQGKYVKAQ